MTDDPLDEMMPPLDDHEEHWHREYDSGMEVIIWVFLALIVVVSCGFAALSIWMLVG